MKKNKKARITLEFAIGIVLSILIMLAVLNIVGGLFRLSNDSRQSFSGLVSLIKDVSDDPAGTLKTTALRMDKETFIIGFAKEDKPYLYTSKILTSSKEGITLENNQFNKSDYDGCKKNKSCICLCRKFESKMNDKFIYEIKCKEDSVFCESFDDFNFTKSFVISRHSKLQPDDVEDFSNPQFRTVFVEKYKGASEKMVAVCENPIDGSCISEEYKKQSEGIEGLKELAKFIESCKNKEFSGEPCSCGAFDFTQNIPEGYNVKFSKSDNKLTITLSDKTKDLGSVEVETTFCTYNLRYPYDYPDDYPEELKTEDYNPVDYPEEIIISHTFNTKEPITQLKYVFYYGDYPDKSNPKKENPVITFVRYYQDNICLASLQPRESGYIVMGSENLNIILLPDNLVQPEEPKEFEGCKIS